MTWKERRIVTILTTIVLVLAAALLVALLMTITTSTMYFITVNRRVQALFLSFFVGILYRSSWMSPKGHKKAHTARPSSAPKSSSMPSR